MTQSTEQERAEIEALARRKAWRYKKSSDPHHSDTYTFNTHTLHDFADALLQAARRAQVVQQSEPVAYLWQHGETGRTRVVMPDTVITADANWIVVGPLYLAAAPQPPEAAQESVEHCARMDLSYAHGMREGWNRCVEGDASGYEKRRELLISEARAAINNSTHADIGNPISKENQQVAEAAPVQMPEPAASACMSEPKEDGTVCTEMMVNPVICTTGWNKLYTEQQVRELLSRK